MVITFLGTKAYIEEENPKHKFHTSTLINYKKKKIIIDWGKDWEEELGRIKPHAILITHAHPDHCFGLKADVTLPIYVTEETAYLLREFSLPNLNILKCYREFKLFDLSILAYEVSHSIKCPAVGYKINTGKITFVYNSDVVSINRQREILSQVDIYIGDGSSMISSLVRRKDNILYGHTSIRTQINWCKKFGIKKAYFTHFGTEAVNLAHNKLQENLCNLGEGDIDIIAAYDGMEVRI